MRVLRLLRLLRLFRWVPALVVPLLLLVSLGGLKTAALAAPTATYGPPQEGAKVILGEFSIDGPAIMGTYSPQTTLAWTGTDHRLNLMTSSDGLHYGNKHILPETSLWRPALAFIDSGRGAPYGTIVLAWTGTDKAHTLNEAYISLPSFQMSKKITFWGETSFTAPALASVNGDINSDVYLAWAGTDGAHTLNVLRHATQSGQNTKHTLWGWRSISRPNLSTNQASQSGTGLILSWTGANQRIAFADSSDGTTWTQPNTSPLTQQSAWAPSLIAFYATAMPEYWLAWTGNGSVGSQSLTVEYTQHYPSWSDTDATTTLHETAISSPEFAYNTVNQQVLLAWTGTDAAHHLNVADISVTAA